MANAYGPYNTLAMLGANFEQTSTTPLMALGQSALGTDNTTWVYVQASEDVATGTCTVSADFALTDTAGNYTAAVAFTSGDYGWVRKTTSPL